MADPDEVEAWRGDRVARWLRQSARLEHQLAPVSEALFAAAALRPGEAVLDVGCGTGPTTWAAAQAVGSGGRVVGLDVSGDMLQAAAAAGPSSGGDGGATVEWLEADAATWDPEAATFDVVLSRFGVMFFDDPAAAFRHLADATRQGGRLVMATWQRRDASDLFAVPLHAAVGAVRASGRTATAAGVDLDAFLADDADGPFSLHGPEVLVGLLEGAGWRDVDVAPHRLDLPFGGGLPPDELAGFATDFGPVRLLLEGMEDEVVARARAAIVEALAERTGPDGAPLLTGAINITTARR